MSGPSRRLPAIDALARGISNLRANAELVIVQLVAMLFMAASFAIPVVLFLRRAGVAPTVLLSDDPQKIQEAFAALDLDPAALVGALGIGLLVLFVGGTVLFLFYCWAQAGTLAVLSAGDAQAPSQRGLPVDVFRTFSWRAFASWSFRYVWRLFWLNNLYLVLLSLALLLFVLPFAFVGTDSLEEGNFGPTCLLACGLAIPLVFLFFVLWIALQVSAAVLVVDDAGVGRAFRRGMTLTGRRLGGLLLLVLLLVSASFLVGGAMLLLKLGVGLAFAEPSALRFGLSAGLEILNFLLSTTLALIFGSALIALVRGESRHDAAPARPPAA